MRQIIGNPPVNPTPAMAGWLKMPGLGEKVVQFHSLLVLTVFPMLVIWLAQLAQWVRRSFGLRCRSIRSRVCRERRPGFPAGIIFLLKSRILILGGENILSSAGDQFHHF